MLRRWLSIGAALCVPVFFCCVVVGYDEDFGPQRRQGNCTTARGEEPIQKPNQDPPAELASKGWGKVTGKIVFEGTPPMPKNVPAMLNHIDKDMCLAAKDMREKQDQTWIVGPDGGVANVVIWVEPPTQKYFKIRDDLKKPANVTLRQPHCAFIPHVVALFPKYRDKTGLHPTGQRLEVLNDSTKAHSFKCLNTTVILGPGTKRFFDFNPAKDPLRAECLIHSWMSAYIWAFDHPYFAVTKDKGTFEMIVPAGVEISVHGWHEARRADWFLSRKITVKDGETLKLDKLSIK